MTEENLQSTAPQTPMLKHVARSDIGMRREENQDSFGIVELGTSKLLIVADGMGGVRGGALASALAVETVKENVTAVGTPKIDDVRRAVEKANGEIFARGAADPTLAGMGTTFVALFFSGTSLHILNVGDSRAYRIRNERIDRLTEDHTLVMELLRSGTIDAEQARNHPVSHMLTRSLGPAAEVDVDCFPCQEGPFRGEIYLLCSDGLYNLVREQEMLALLQENVLEKGVEKLIELANKRGGTDNITIVAAELGVGFPELPSELAAVDIDLMDEASAVALLEATAEASTNGKNHGHVNGSAVEHDAVDGAAELKTEANSGNADDVKTVRSESKSTSNLAQGSNGDGEKSKFHDSPESLAQTQKLEGKVSIDSLRASYAQGVADGAKSEKVNQTKSDSQIPATSEKGSERAGLFSSAFSAVLCLLGAALGGGMVGVIFSAPYSDTTSAHGTNPKGITNHGEEREAASLFPPGLRGVAGEAAGKEQAEQPSYTNQSAFTAVQRRQKILQARLQQLDQKLSAFEQPLAGSLGKSLNEASEVRAQLEEKLSSLRNEIDSATRRMAVWSGRQKRLETTEPINLVSEVAVSSDGVREKKVAFESATWQYLKEAERLEYSPNDATLAQHVAELVRTRNQRMEELFKSLRTAISGGILESQQSIADLTFERDRVEADIRNLEETLSFVRLLASGDRTAREQKRAELQRERDQVGSELKELMRFSDTFGGEVPPAANVENSRAERR